MLPESLKMIFLELVVEGTFVKKGKDAVVGTMDVRVGLILLSFLACSWACDARILATANLSGEENSIGNVDFCTICEDYANVTLNYLNDTKTQTEVMNSLHRACSQMHGLEDLCMTMVDHYAPLFFLEVSSMQPEELCDGAGLCSKVKMSSLSGKQNKCDLCHNAVDEVLVKLKDPDTKLGIIEVLLKACNAMEDYSKKCKSMVFQYGPLILVKAEKFIEDVDICTTLHACSKQNAITADVLLAEGGIAMVTSS
ncbi:hypothetical protein Cgig2_017142 [Carnegiea gigantea]|uniref:Pulmonary surfactant-associated protein B n=1 Tax=Carnegiea gigantea TaxID=171969 RepID=A0A9Q1JPJ4_9CARY|nr:hypothetical protein Cgig2_017142 [Carnegiea gigantea]